jgi:PAS domain S-box-containing protein
MTRFRTPSKVFSLLVIAIGAVGVTGWVLDIPAFKTVFPGLVTMKANTGICLMLVGVALFLLENDNAGRSPRLVARMFSLLAVLVGAASLCEHLFGWNLGIDQLLFHESLAEAGPSFPGRMGPAACCDFILLGSALAVIDVQNRRGFWLSPYLAAASLPITMLAFLSYFYGVQPISSLTIYSSIALHTVFAFLALCAGILLARPDREFMPSFLGNTSGAILARRLFPAALLLPPFLGWLAVLGRKGNLYGPHYGTAWVVTILTSVFSLLISLTARAINRAEAERDQGEEDLRGIQQTLIERETVLRTVTNEARVGLVMVSQERRYLFANNTYADILGLPNSNILGKKVGEILPHMYDQISPNLDRAFTGQRVSYELHLAAQPIDGDERFYDVIYQPRTEGPAEPYVVVVLVDITERKKVQERLERTVAERTAQLREANENLQTFSNSAAHDLRSPLRTIQSFSSLVLEDFGAALPPEAKVYLERVVVATDHMGALLHDLLDYSKMTQAEITLETVNLNATVRDALGFLDRDIKSQNAAITVSNSLPPVIAHSATLLILVQNLVSNGLKFMAAGTRPIIEISAEEYLEDKLNSVPANKTTPEPLPSAPGSSPVSLRRLVRLSVRDNGIGISSADISKLFTAFSRLHGKDAYPGTGLGLAIVKKAAERMGGRVGVESSPDQGSRFWIDLPRA